MKGNVGIHNELHRFLFIHGSMWPSGWVLHSKSKGLGFDFCWSCLEVSGKLLIPYYLYPPSSDGYQVEQNIEKIVNDILC